MEVQNMKTLIVHIEFDDIEEEALRERIDAAIPDPARKDVQGVSWRVFSSLGEAETWEETGEYPD